MRLHLRRLHLHPPGPAGRRGEGAAARTLLALAADAMSGPGGLAAYLRTRQFGAPYSGKPLPLDVGRVRASRTTCAARSSCATGTARGPAAATGPAGCQVHHLVTRSEGGKTRLEDLSCTARTTTRCASTASAGP